MYLTGSSSLNERGLLQRKPKDLDYIITEQDYSEFVSKNEKKIAVINKTKFGETVHMMGKPPLEFEIIDRNPSSIELVRLLEENQDYDVISEMKVIKPSVLLMIKMSHRFLRNSPHFKKTMNDIIYLRTITEMPSYSTEWLKIRNKETYNYAHPSLNQSKMDFFKDDFYVWDHDSIHEAIKLLDRPAFEYIKKDKAEVSCSKDKFYEQPEFVRLATVYEETAVLALERHQLPTNFKHPPDKSFMISLEKVCTSITSGWWRNFAWENYHKVIALFEELGHSFYIEKFNKAKEAGRLVPWSK